MRQRGFFENLASTGLLGEDEREWAREYGQSADIEALARENAELRADQAFTGVQAAALVKQVGEQRREIERLRMLVKVLGETLVDLGVIGDKVLDYRLEAALDEAAAARAAAPAARAAEPQVACVACGGSFPASKTTVTGRGTVCDGCFARLG